MKIGDRTIGGSSRCFIIAEAGVNHNGCMKTAKKLIKEAAKAGADCVKFQTFKTEELVSENAPKSEYQNQTTDPKESQADMLKKLELTEDNFIELKKECENQGIMFLSTPFDVPSARALNRIGVDAYKVPSSEVTNISFIEYLAGFGKPLIVSTGMCTIGDVDRVYQVLARRRRPAPFCLLHCVSEYPAKFHDTNLRAMDTLSSAFQVPIGYSDHTLGIHIPVAAVARGAKIIEKHFTLDRTMEGPDHRASIEPQELQDMVRNIRQVESAIGDGGKNPVPIEVKNSTAARKSLVATRDLKKGEVINCKEMVTVKRPGNGLPPFFEDLIDGMRLTEDVKRDEVLLKSHFTE